MFMFYKDNKIIDSFKSLALTISVKANSTLKENKLCHISTIDDTLSTLNTNHKWYKPLSNFKEKYNEFVDIVFSKPAPEADRSLVEKCDNMISSCIKFSSEFCVVPYKDISASKKDVDLVRNNVKDAINDLIKYIGKIKNILVFKMKAKL